MSSSKVDAAVFAAVRGADPRLGDLEWDSQDTGCPKPYGVLKSLPALEESADTLGSMLEHCGYRVQVFAVTRAEAREVVEAVEGALVWQALGVAGFVETRKRSSDCFEEPERDGEGNRVYQGLLDLTVVVDREPGT